MFIYNVLEQEPFLGFMPQDVHDWIITHRNEQDIADAYAAVYRQVNCLMHLEDEIDDPWVGVAYDNWKAVLEEIHEIIVATLAEDNRTKGTNYPLSGIGTYYVVKPFMERNGYHDGRGWWNKNK